MISNVINSYCVRGWIVLYIWGLYMKIRDGFMKFIYIIELRKLKVLFLSIFENIKIFWRFGYRNNGYFFFFGFI